MCTRWSLKLESGEPVSSPAIPRTTSSSPCSSTSPPIRFSCSIETTRSDSFSRTWATLEKRVSPSANWPMVESTGSMSGIGLQSISTPRSRTPSWRTRIPPAAGSSSIGSPIPGTTSREGDSGGGAAGAVDLGAPVEEDVGRVDRGGGEAEGERADVRRQRDLGGAGGLVALDLEAAPVVGDAAPEPDLPHHVHGQLDVRLLVQGALDLDRCRAAGEGGDDQQPRDPLRERPRDRHPAAARALRRDRDRRRRVGRLELDPDRAE